MTGSRVRSFTTDEARRIGEQIGVDWSQAALHPELHGQLAVGARVLGEVVLAAVHFPVKVALACLGGHTDSGAVQLEGASISAGLAEVTAEDTLESLIARADHAPAYMGPLQAPKRPGARIQSA